MTIPHLDPAAPLAHGGLGVHTLEQVAAFGTDWLYVAVPMALIALAGVLLVRLGDRTLAVADTAGPRRSPAERLAAGLTRLTGYPAWAALPALLVPAALVVAGIGFFWDVAWHIAVGRDEFLFSPPHVAIGAGLALMGVAGGGSIAYASHHERPEVGLRRGRLVAPWGSLALAWIGTAGMVGFFVDELWHAAYGLDVTMWSPPHVTMISGAAVAPLALWLVLTEAGPDAGTRRARRLSIGYAASLLLVSMSAWQLEWDLGVPRWQLLLQPVQIAAAAGFALVGVREALGRGAALLTWARFTVARLALLALTDLVWGLGTPRMPLLLPAALAVEAVAHVGRDWSVRRRTAVGGLAVGTVGLAGEWAWSQVAFANPWTTSLLPGLALATLAAVAAALLGAAFGRAATWRVPGIDARLLTACGVALLAVLVALLPRNAPDATLTIRTAPAAVSDTGDARVTVTVQADPVDALDDTELRQVMAWQGGGQVIAHLVPTDDPGTYVTEGPVPVGGTWKTIVRVSREDTMGVAPVALPADEEIGASAIPLVDERTVPLVEDDVLLLREATEGPAWPGVVGYAWVASAMGLLVGLVVTGAVVSDRRRRRSGLSAARGPRSPLPDREPAGRR
ncbi:MAG: hypothetical protein ACLGIR_06555 [Actinomycetes bacterium]